MNRPTVLVTGGAGYIGSHACVELVAAGFCPIVFDNFANSFPEAVRAASEVAGFDIPVIAGDICNTEQLESAVRRHQTQAVMHFAGLKAVGESVSQPLSYYHNNVVGTLSLLHAMERCDVRTLVFSSSATVYGQPERIPLDESCGLGATNPYGRTKQIIEDILRDLASSDPRWRISLLRYFNPVGAHSSGMIGEDPQGTPNNLLPFVAQVAVGRRPCLNVFGDDYATKDGTGVRDYIHVVDLVQGHLAALRFLQNNSGIHTHNLGTGNGYSVLEVVAAFSQISGRPIPYKVIARRPGDVAESWADPAKALRELGWQATRTLEDMCRDAWNWQQRNPNGFRQ